MSRVVEKVLKGVRVNVVDSEEQRAFFEEFVNGFKVNCVIVSISQLVIHLLDDLLFFDLERISSIFPSVGKLNFLIEDSVVVLCDFF